MGFDPREVTLRPVPRAQKPPAPVGRPPAVPRMTGEQRPSVLVCVREGCQKKLRQGNTTSKCQKHHREDARAARRARVCKSANCGTVLAPLNVSGWCRPCKPKYRTCNHCPNELGFHNKTGICQNCKGALDVSTIDRS